MPKKKLLTRDERWMLWEAFKVLLLIALGLGLWVWAMTW